MIHTRDTFRTHKLWSNLAIQLRPVSANLVRMVCLPWKSDFGALNEITPESVPPGFHDFIFFLCVCVCVIFAIKMTDFVVVISKNLWKKCAIYI